MPRDTARRQERRAATFAVASGALRRPIAVDEAPELFRHIDSKAAGFGIRRLAEIDINQLLPAPSCVPWLQEMTLLSYAAWRGRDHFVSALLRAGANPGICAGSCDARPREFVQRLPAPLAVWLVRALERLRHRGARGAEPCRCGAPARLRWRCGHAGCERCLWDEVLRLGVEGAELPCGECRGRADLGDPPLPAEVESMLDAAVKPAADWDCDECTFANFKRRLSCRNCGAHFRLIRGLAFDVEGGSEDAPVDAAISKQRWSALPTLEVDLPPQESFKALDLESSASFRLGRTQDERTAELLKAAACGDCRRLRALFQAGVDLNAQNEYGQTAAFLAACHNQAPALVWLCSIGADVSCQAHGGSTPLSAALARGCSGAARALEARCPESRALPLASLESRFCDPPTACLAPGSVEDLIPGDAAHVGRGSFCIDGAFPEEFLLRLDRLFESLPEAEPSKDSTNDRRYYCDAEGWICAALELALHNSERSKVVSRVMAHMRFLHYTELGAGLAPHVDLARTNPEGRRSTHTFILYLTNSNEGGETVLLDRLDIPQPCALSTVVPSRGRLLVFPHQCPHLARGVLEVPKILLRGEMFRE